MTAAIPAVAERAAAGRLATGATSVQQAKQTLTGKKDSAPSKTGPGNVPDRKDSRISPERTSSANRDYGRGARPRRSPGPRTTARSMQPHVRVLVAEWLLAAILIAVTVPSEKGSKGYGQMMSTIMMRLTALTGLFFALTLIGTVQRAAKFAIWFGFIVDLGILYHATTSGSTKAIANVFKGQSIMTSSNGVTLASDFTSKDDPPQPTPYSPPGSGSGSNSGSGNSGSNSGTPGAYLNPNYPGGAGTTIPSAQIPGIPA